MTPTQRKAMEQALEALCLHQAAHPVAYRQAISCLRAALAEQPAEQEPWMYRIWSDASEKWELTDDSGWPAEPLYTAPQQPQSTAGLSALLNAANENDPGRWEIGFRNIVAILYGPKHPFEIKDVVERVRELAQPAIPPGYKLVPEVPTPEMIEAANEGDDEYTLRNFGPGVPRVMQGPEDHYAAMLAAAPEAPQPAKRVPLTDEQIGAVLAVAFPDDAEPDGSWKLARYELDIFRAAEAAHGITGETE